MAEMNPNKSSVKATLPLQKAFNIRIKLFEKLRGCETNGRERIVDMVKRKLEEIDGVHRKANTDCLLFKRISDGAYLNIGAPTGILEENETYECNLKTKMGKKTTDMMRFYHSEKFDKTWGIKSFYVTLTEVGFSVSYFQKFKPIGKLLIDFFPGETLYEALYRDGRLREQTKDGLVIRMCDFLTENIVEISLNDQASNHAEEVLKFKKRKSINEKLPPEVPPLPEPQEHGQVMTEVKMEPATPLMANRSNTEHPASTLNPPSSAQKASKVYENLHTVEGLTIYLKEKLGLEIPNQSDEYKETSHHDDKVKQTKKENDKIFKKHYQNFALHFHHRVFLSDLEETIRLMKHSIGAIIAVNISNVKECGATCFRIGTKYVITNNHVVDDIKRLGIKWSSCYVDFNYEEQGELGYCFPFASNPVLVSSIELDYAILELSSNGNRGFPQSLTEIGYNISPGRQLKDEECLSFIGHPAGLKKQMDVSCPIKNEDSINNHLVLALQVLNKEEFQKHRMKVLTAETNPNSAVYDVSTFFEGSSGSPGFLMHEKLLVALHSRGVPFEGNRNCFAVEEGILMARVVKDIISKMDGMHHDEVQKKLQLGDIFGKSTAENFYPEKMDIN